MKRPLLTAGTLFVLGELAYRVKKYGIFYSILIISVVIVMSSILGRFFKSLSLLLFLCFPLGAVWAFGFYSNDATLYKMAESEERISVNAYVSAVNITSSGYRVTLKSNRYKLIMNIRTEKLKDEGYEELEEKWQDEGHEELEDNLLAGKYISVVGNLKRIEGCTNPGAMDMEEYYAGQGIRCEIVPESYEIREDKEKRFITFLSKTRRKMGRIIDRYFDDESASILKTMILGDKSTLSSDTRLMYQRCGIAHILAISGLHVGLVAGIITWLLSLMRIRRNVSSILSIILIILYGMLTGFAPATLRAVIMIILIKTAFLMGRTADMPTSMMEALLIMLIINPDGIFSTGLLMSFMAVLGLYTGNLVYKTVFGRERFMRLPVKLRGILKTGLMGMISSFSVTIWMLPLIIRSYYEVPIYAMILNLLVTTLLTVVIGAGMVLLLFGLFAGEAGFCDYICRLVSWVDTFILNIYKELCGFFLKLPYAVVSTGHIELWQMGVYYCLITLFIYAVWRSGTRRLWAKGNRNGREDKRNQNGGGKKGGAGMRMRRFGLVLVGDFILAGLIVGSGKLINSLNDETVFLDVGQGDGSIMHENGKSFVFDCGSSSRDNIGKNVLIPALKYYGMTDIDMVFISHMDTDHVSGILYLLENREAYGIEVRAIGIAEGIKEDENYERLLMASEGIKIVRLSKGDRIGENIEVIYPDGRDDRNDDNRSSGGVEESDMDINEYSLVLRYIDDEKEILYTGDIGAEAEGMIVENQLFSDEKRVRILKCPHHGSRYSSTEEFLDWYSPDITVISCGRNNIYGHPAEATLGRLRTQGCEIYRTDRQGAVIIVSRGRVI